MGNSYEYEVAERLREVAVRNGGPAAFAKLLGMRPQNLNDYVSDPPKSLPGNKLRGRIREKLGEDVEYYVMYGSKEEIDAKAKRGAELIFRNTGTEKALMLSVIDEYKIETSAELRRRLQWFEQSQQLLTKMTDEKSQAGSKLKGKKK